MKNATTRNILLVAAAILWVAPAMLAQMAQPQAPQPQQNVQQMQPASAPASLCANRPLCYEANDFVVTVSEFRTSVDGRGTKILDAMLHFQNKTNQPISLGYVDGSGAAIDDMGNRFVLNTYGGGVRGLGVVAGNNMDPKFNLSAGGTGDAQLELWWAPGGHPSGVSYQMEFSIREIERIEGNQWTLGGESLIHYQGLANGVGVAPVSAPMVSGSGAGSVGGAVNSFVPGQANVVSAAGQPMNAYSTQPCPPGSATSGTLTNTANAAAGQNQNANGAINNASQAISNLGSLFHKKKAAATPATTANAATPCTPATNVSGTSAVPVGNAAVPASTAAAPAVSAAPNTNPAVAARPTTVPASTAAVKRTAVTAPAQAGAAKTTAQKPSPAVVQTSLKQPAPAAKTTTPPAKKPATTASTTTTTNNTATTK